MARRFVKLTYELVRHHFNYNPETGKITWRNPRVGWTPIGSVAGHLDHKGHRIVGIYGKQYRAGRLIWLYMTGKWPSGEIDHKDRVRDNDKWLNLRESSSQQNSCNRKFSNKHGLPGVSEVRGGFTARATVNGARKYLGFFPTADLAAAEVVKARISNGKEFACLEAK